MTAKHFYVGQVFCISLIAHRARSTLLTALTFRNPHNAEQTGDVFCSAVVSTEASRLDDSDLLAGCSLCALHLVVVLNWT